MMREHGQDFDGMRNFLKKYLFISDDTIELQMFQGFQNCAWCKCACPGRRVTRDNKISILYQGQLYAK